MVWERIVAGAGPLVIVLVVVGFVVFFALRRVGDDGLCRPAAA
jgi:hypothetical protein